MKVRAEGSAAGEYRLVAVEAENTGRPTVPSHLACGEARPGLDGGGPGSVWHFRCEMETSTGIGFNLALVAASIFIVDDQGRELQPFERLSAGFDGPPGAPGYVEFLALGPADSRAVTVYYGDGSIRVPME